MTTSKRKPITENAWLLKRLDEWHSILERKPDYPFSQQQELILEYWRIPEKSDADLRKLAALVRSERAHENALAAKKRADKILQEKKSAERKARNKRCFDAVGLLMHAGLVDSKTAELNMPAEQLLGGLLALANVTDPEVLQQWSAAGAAALAPEPEPEPEPEPQPEPEPELDLDDPLTWPV